MQVVTIPVSFAIWASTIPVGAQTPFVTVSPAPTLSTIVGMLTKTGEPQDSAPQKWRFELSPTYLYAQYNGRKLYISGASLAAKSDKYQARVQFERAYAKGLTAGTRFDTESSGIGGSVRLKSSDRQQLWLDLDFMSPKTGTAVDANTNSTVPYAGPKVYGAQFRLQSTPDQRPPSDMSYTPDDPFGWFFQGGTFYVLAGAGPAKATVWNVSSGMKMPLGKQFKFGVEVGAFYDVPVNFVAEKSGSMRFRLAGSLEAVLSRNASLQFQATLYPRGLPLAGTDFAGISSFLVYEPGGTVQQLRSNRVGYLQAKLVLRFP